MMYSSGRTLRKRFLTKEEKLAHQKLQEVRKREARVKALRESKLRKAKAKKEREIQKRRAESLMKSSLQGCESEFRFVVEQWAKDKSVAQVNKFFRLLEEFKCPMDPCYGKPGHSQGVLRKNKCGYEKLCYGLHLPDAVLGSDFWNRDYQREYDRAHELDGILHEMW
jgi:hypothetical protein